MKSTTRIFAYIVSITLPPILGYLVSHTLSGDFKWNIWSVSTLAVITAVCAVAVLYWDWQKAMKDIEASLGIFDRINRIPMGNIISSYHDYYHSGKEDEQIKAQLSKKRKVLIVGKPLSGKTRAALEAIKSVVPKNTYLLVPKDPTSENMRNLRIPRTICFLGSKPSIVILLDDLPDFLSKDVDALTRNVRRDAKKGEVWIIATCRRGDLDKVQQDPRAKEICRGLLDPISLLDIDQTTAQEIASNTGHQLDPFNFDGTTGSIVIGIGEAKARFNSLTSDAINALKSLRILRSIGRKEWKDEYIRLVCTSILNSKGSFETAKALKELRSKEFIKFSKQKSKNDYVEAQHDIYLDDSFMDLSDSVVDWIGFYEKLGQVFIEKNDYEGLVNLGDAFFKLKDYKKAEDILDKCVKLSPTFLMAYEYKANLLFIEKRLEEGEKTLRQLRSIIKNKEQEARVLLRIGDILYKNENIVEAANKYKQVLQIANETETRYHALDKYGELYLVAHQFAEAEKIYQQADIEAEKQQEDIKATIKADLIVSILVQQDYTEAKDLLKVLFAFACKNNLIAVTWSRILIRVGTLLQEKPKSLEICEQTCLEIVAKDDPSGSQLNDIANLILIEGKLEQARRIYEFCIQNNPKKREKELAMLDIGSLLSRQKKYKEAMVYYEKAKSMLDDDALTAIAIGNIGDCILNDLHDTDRAMELYEESKKLADKAQDDNARCAAYCGLADVFLAQGKTEKAEEYYRKAMKIPVEYSFWPYIYLGLGKALTKSGQFEDARFYLLSGKEMSKHIELISDFSDALNELTKLNTGRWNL